MCMNVCTCTAVRVLMKGRQHVADLGLIFSPYKLLVSSTGIADIRLFYIDDEFFVIFLNTQLFIILFLHSNSEIIFFTCTVVRYS